jgi:hypothetical protein
VSNKDVKQDSLDNLADALTEDILNTPDDELLREVEEDNGDPRALANKFDQILERAEKQVFGTAHSAASPQVRSSILDFPIRLPDEKIRWVNGIFGLGSRISEFLSSLTPRSLAWSATAAAVAILMPAAVITAVVLKEQSTPSEESLARKADRLPRVAVLRPDVAVEPPPLDQMAVQSPPPAPVQESGGSSAAPAPTIEIGSSVERRLSGEEIGRLIKRGRELIFAGNIDAARLALKEAAEAGNAAAALELGGTYDPTILQKQQAQWIKAWQQRRAPVGEAERVGVAERVGRGRTYGANSQVAELPAITPDFDTLAERVMTSEADITKAKLWYEKAKDLGSTEAAARLERLRSVPGPRR